MQHVCMFPDRSTLHEEYHAFKVAKRILRTPPHTKLDLASMDYWNPPRACSGHPLLSSSSMCRKVGSNATAERALSAGW